MMNSVSDQGILKRMRNEKQSYNDARLKWESLYSKFLKENKGRKPKELLMSLWSILTFILVLLIYFINRSICFIFGLRFLPYFSKIRIVDFLNDLSSKIIRNLSPNKKGTISRVELIELALRNMQAKKTRTWVTIGGMTIGIGAIVFLVSIGYGLQTLVITRVARLEEMRQADVSTQTGGKIKITDEALASFNSLTNVRDALPMIAVVGSVSYNNSSSDMAVYGVTTEYLKQSAIKPTSGGYFGSDELSSPLGKTVDTKVVNTTSTQSTRDSSIDWVEIPSESETESSPDTKIVELGTDAKREAVVNTSMLKVLGISESNAVGTVFQASFILTSDLLVDQSLKVQSKVADYTIVGVIQDQSTPLFYVPFVDLKSLGATYYSQVKVVVNSADNLGTVRNQIESMGYMTKSVSDTVAQINALFTTARALLALLGMVALAVAALGMFNTLTVSLLERTREVGLMKAMGMRSAEVQELFLTESMIMGFFGGVSGIVLGAIIGKVLGILLSFVTVSKGAGIVDVSTIPTSFIIVIILLSLFVGIATGIYPARRATKISALDALRYE